ncbi:hypothetical protein GCM10008171_19500 [Methylopila jiangsuensis]|uniref:Uncharacterized protein n=1 Tax=Methylopila jiangsuensis TaxID=586230 RepID=A0A9W6JFM3_9HYPH|nr:hypothetical protein [Methylopila jiangsuensis]MDR6286953.1 hypothetical protein [Methylopila jiangsuensis]GLK76696.1 hypothetical protein GCM10008171_19500 [Methylopila jiangsuensis]
MNRRGFLSIAAASPLAGSAALASAPADRHSRLRAELERLAAWSASLNARSGHASEEEWDRLALAERAAYDEIEALPITRENAVIRALAVLNIYDGDLAEFVDRQPTTDMRLALLVLKDLVTETAS